MPTMVAYSSAMETADATAVMSALAHPTRFRCFSTLVERGQCSAKELAEAVEVPKNLLTGHTTILTQAGLISAVRTGRTVTYTPVKDRLRSLVELLEQMTG